MTSPTGPRWERTGSVVTDERGAILRTVSCRRYYPDDDGYPGDMGDDDALAAHVADLLNGAEDTDDDRANLRAILRAAYDGFVKWDHEPTTFTRRRELIERIEQVLR